MIIGSANKSGLLLGTSAIDVMIGDQEMFLLPVDLLGFLPDEEDDIYKRGQDNIKGFEGDDTLIGDFGDRTVVLSNPDFEQVVATTPNYFGNDNLHGGLGGDNLYGDAETEYVLLGANIQIGEEGDTVLYETQGGHDVIHAGEGDDLLVGNTGEYHLSMSNLLYDESGEPDGEGEFGVTMLNYATGFEHNNLFGREGEDELIGQHGEFEMSVSESTITNVTFSFESDLLRGGEGDDELFGDNKEQSLSLVENTEVDGLVFDYAGDRLHGDDGMDMIVGDVGFLSLEVDESITLENLVYRFGDDNIHGGNDDDTLYGDVWEIDEATLEWATIEGGNDQLHGGQGMDWIFGQFGDDTINGNEDADTFVYSGLLHNGDDMIMDYEIGIDEVLSIDGAEFSEGDPDGDGNLVVNVEGPGMEPMGTITFMGIESFGDVSFVV